MVVFKNHLVAVDRICPKSESGSRAYSADQYGGRDQFQLLSRLPGFPEAANSEYPTAEPGLSKNLNKITVITENIGGTSLALLLR